MHEVSLAFFWHQHQPYYPDDVAGENPMPWVRLHGTKDYWGMAMLLKEVARAARHDQPGAQPARSSCRPTPTAATRTRTSACRALPADGLSEEDTYYLLDNFFMVHPDQMIRPFPRYYELYQKARPGGRFGRESPQAIQQERRHRPAMLVEPGVDPSAGLRARPRTGRVPQQGPRLDGERKAVAAGKADGTAPAGRAAASGTAGARASGADHDALLPPDLAAAVGQAAGPPRDAQRDAAEPSRRLSRGRAGAHSPGGRVPRETVRAEAAGNVALGRLGLPGASFRPSPRPASSGSAPTRKSSPARPTAGSPATATDTFAIPRCSIARGAPRNRASRCNWSSATTP